MESSSADVESTSHPRELLQAIGLALEELTSESMGQANDSPDELTVFHAFTIPRVGLRDYVMRIGCFASCSPECFVVAVVLLNRLLMYSPHIKLSLYTAHRLLATAVVLAVKSTDDYYYRNTYYATLSGVSTRELNRLEVSFLSALQYDLHVSAEEFAMYRDRLMWYVVDSALQPDAMALHTASPLSPVASSPWSRVWAPGCVVGEDDDDLLVTPAPTTSSAWEDEGVSAASARSSPTPPSSAGCIIVR